MRSVDALRRALRRIPPAALALGALALSAGGLRGEGLPWQNDWKAAFASARAERKMVFVDFWASWCGPCREMDDRTFPDEAVRRRLSGFTLLKVDVDRSTIARTHRVTSYPTYAVFDPWENERFRFTGFEEPAPFSAKLDVVLTAASVMVEAGDSLNRKESPEPYRTIGRAYLKCRAFADARDAFGRCRKLAARAGDASLAQKSEIDEAVAWAFEGEVDRGLGILEKVASKPTDRDCGAAAWIAIGHIRRGRHDRTGAAEAYRRAVDADPEDAALRSEAAASLSAVQK